MLPCNTISRLILSMLVWVLTGKFKQCKNMKHWKVIKFQTAQIINMYVVPHNRNDVSVQLMRFAAWKFYSRLYFSTHYVIVVPNLGWFDYTKEWETRLVGNFLMIDISRMLSQERHYWQTVMFLNMKIYRDTIILIYVSKCRDSAQYSTHPDTAFPVDVHHNF